MNFETWNKRLLGHFFGEFASGEQIRLAISREVLDVEFSDLGGSPQFLNVVRRGSTYPSKYQAGYGCWYRPETILDNALGLWEQWKNAKRRHVGYEVIPHDAPPYIPYLALFCYAWTVEGAELAGNNFYDRLETLYPRHNLSHDFGQVTPLWQGLQEWTEKTNGRFGKFVVDKLGAMPYVGIPKAQVLLTATKVERLPILYAALGMRPGHNVTPDQLRNALISRRLASQYTIGYNLFDSIEKNDEIGKSAVDQLLQHLAQWDGDVSASYRDYAQRESSAAQEAASFKGRLGISLIPSNENKTWALGTLLEADSLPSGAIQINHAGNIWTAQLADSIAGPFSNAATSELLSGVFILETENDCALSGRWTDESDGQREINISYFRKPIRTLMWSGPVLIEQSGLPAEGDVYLLLHEKVMSNWLLWTRELPKTVVLRNDLPQDGLPEGWKLIYVSGLKNIPDEIWGRFPDGGEETRPRPRVLRIIGGSRARRTGTRRAYLPYDPPKIIAEIEGTYSLKATGATLQELDYDPAAIPSWISEFRTSCCRVYSVLPKDGSSIVSISAVASENEIARVTFGLVWDSCDLSPDDLNAFRVDNLGASAKVGLIGLCADLPATPHVIVSTKTSQGSSLGQEFILSHPSFKVLDWFANATRAPYSRVREHFLKFSRNTMEPSRELRAMAQLGHVEIQSDSRGRWGYIHAAPPTLYTLPTSKNDGIHGVITGSYTIDQLMRFCQIARESNLSVTFQAQLGGKHGYRLVPGRVSVHGSSIEAIKGLAEKTNFLFVSNGSAALAAWAGSIESWYQRLQWYSEAGPMAEASYRPCEFRTLDGDAGMYWGRHKLVRVDDAITRRHFSYYLVRKTESDFNHAAIAQRSWAAWYVHRETMLGLYRTLGLPPQPIPIAYDANSGVLYFPIELEPPSIINRALTLCSGLSPRVLSTRECTAYSDPEFSFAPKAGFVGNCLAYYDVPESIASTALNRLGATPKQFSRGMLI